MPLTKFASKISEEFALQQQKEKSMEAINNALSSLGVSTLIESDISFPKKEEKNFSILSFTDIAGSDWILSGTFNAPSKLFLSIEVSGIDTFTKIDINTLMNNISEIERQKLELTEEEKNKINEKGETPFSLLIPIRIPELRPSLSFGFSYGRTRQPTEKPYARFGTPFSQVI